MLTELLFVALALVLLYAGFHLTRYGEAIAEKTRISTTWIGLFLVAAVTSVPELVTGFSSILAVGEPDFAVGDVLGSTVFNLMLAAAAAIATRKYVIAAIDSRMYRLVGAYLTIMLALAGGGIALARFGGVAKWLGLATAGLVAVYLISIRHLFHAQADHTPPTSTAWDHLSRGRIFTRYAVFSIAVIGAAFALPYVAKQLTDERGLDVSFVGTALLAATTSLPEVVVTVTAIRLRSPNLAIGGLLGSNLSDLVILAIDDLIYAKGPLLAAIEPDHAWTVLASLLMTWLFVAGLPARRRPRIVLIAAVLIIGAALFVALVASGQA